MMNAKFWARREVFSDDITLFVRGELRDGAMAYPDAVVWRIPKSEEDGVSRPPLMTVDQGGAQRLMDALWDAGLRPSEGSGSAGQLAAVQNHLKDMRVIVGEQLRVKL